jgi:hypothetical protein
MKNIINSFSEKIDLWNLTKNYGIKCIQSYIEKDSDNFTKKYNIKTEHFLFSKKNQSLICFNSENNSFIIRTTYNLTLQTPTFSTTGFYSLDIDNEENIVDDCFFIE